LRFLDPGEHVGYGAEDAPEHQLRGLG
jgi:hypothetical protein